MAKRRNVGGTYMNVREKDSTKGKKGTIMGKWSPNDSKEKEIKKTTQAKKSTSTKATTKTETKKKPVTKKKVVEKKENTKLSSTKIENEPQRNILPWLAIGLVIGVGLGYAFNQIVLGIVLGLIAGFVIGLLL